MNLRNTWMALAAVALLALPAKAADKGGPKNVFADAPVAPAKSWTGCYLKLFGGASAMDTKAGLETAPPGSVTIVELDGISATGGIVGAGVGCDVQLAKSGFVIGAFADYAKHSGADWHLRVLPATANVDFSTGLDNEVAFGVRAGFLVSPTTLVYILGAYSQLEMDSFGGSVGGTVIPGALSFSKFDGWQIGTGVEAMLAGGWALALEYRMGVYDMQSQAIAPAAPINLAVEPTTHSVRGSLSYRFNFGQ